MEKTYLKYWVRGLNAKGSQLYIQFVIYNFFIIKFIRTPSLSDSSCKHPISILLVTQLVNNAQSDFYINSIAREMGSMHIRPKPSKQKDECPIYQKFHWINRAISSYINHNVSRENIINIFTICDELN